MSEVCTNTYVQDLGNQYEKVSDYIAFLFEQYVPYMWYVLLGTTGVWSAVMGVMIIVANKNEDKHKARRIVASYVIGLVIIAFITVACPYLVNGIAAFVAA